MWGNIDPLWGNIDPLWGNIDPLWGNIDPLWGNIDPLWGNIDPLWGNIDPLWGNIDPLWGNIDPLWGNIDPLWGNIDPLWGNIDPLWGNIDPLWGNIDPLSGHVTPRWGNIDPLWGNIDPLWGNIDPLWGNIDPLWGNIDPLWGNIDPLWGNIDPLWGNIDPLWGNIDPLTVVGPYWQQASTVWGAINMEWGYLRSSNAADYTSLQHDLQSFLAHSQETWGDAYGRATSKDFMADFAAPMLAKFGIDPNDPASLANVDIRTRAAFFMDWYDGLMAYSGLPRVDWWMRAVNWSPLITRIQNPGTHAVIGVLDSRFTDRTTNVAHLEFVGGYDYHVNDHGAAVASLIASQHAPGMVMGIAPNSPVKLYNPFDYTGTTNWEDVTAGINALYNAGAYVINASLGIPGQVLDQEWAQILTAPEVNQAEHPFVLVKAAGNEGVAQTVDIDWIGSAPNNVIVVGSVGPTGHVSYFSNTPGNACILVGGICEEQNKLMYRFIVAPGENILVSDNNNGVRRVSGTSFSAPLVTGTVALLQDRWPWLKQHPAETVQIVFQSARDLGAPGVDPVYGWGMLDVEASQSPLSFDNLTILQPNTVPDGTGYSPTMPAASLKSAILDPGQLDLWQQQGAYIIAFENIGSTFRDFAIPLSSMLRGENVGLDGENKPFQSYLYQRLIDWANAPGALSFNVRSTRYVDDDWSYSLTATQSSPEEIRHGEGPVHYEFAATNKELGFGLSFGEGSGAFALNSLGGFAMRSDFDPATGGVNPVLGFASGGAYGRAELALGERARLSVGFTQKEDDHLIIDPRFGPMLEEQLSPNRAFASVATMDYEVGGGLMLTASLTALNESDGLLGSQGSGLFAMTQGARTNAATFGASYELAGGWKLFGSATLARSAAPQFDNPQLSFATPNLTSTAYELVAMKSGVFADFDNLRLSLAQPLHVERGALQVSSLQVIDRQTGALGTVARQWDVSGRREVRMEAIYGLPIAEGTGQLDGYALVDLNPHFSHSNAPELALGFRARFGL